MSYTPTKWTSSTIISAHALNNIESQYSSLMDIEDDWNSHGERYYEKLAARTRFFNSQLMGQNSGADADTLDGHAASEILGVGMPIGSYMWWTSADIPTGWVKCDGFNNTQDCRGSFILGVSSGNAVGTWGGQSTVTPEKGSVWISGTKLTANQMPYHSHNYKDYFGTNFNGCTSTYGDPGSYRWSTGSTTTGLSTQSTENNVEHTHTSGSDVTWKAENNMPPYRVLYLIKKVST